MKSSLVAPIFGQVSAMDLHSTELRRIAPADSLEELTGMLHEAFMELGRMGLNCTCVDQSVQVTRERTGKGDCYVATCAGRLVGTVTLYGPDRRSQSHWYHRAEVASVHQLAVSPEFQSRGLGSALLDHAGRWAKARGYAELALDAAQPARHLLAFYMRHGYRFVESVRFQGKAYFSVVLSKQLVGPETGPFTANDTSSPRRLVRQAPGSRTTAEPVFTRSIQASP